MPEIMTQAAAPSAPEHSYSPADVARLRSLSRPGFSVRTFVKTVPPVAVVALLVLVALVAASILIYSFWILPDQVRAVQLEGEVSSNAQKIDKLRSDIVDPGPMLHEFEEIQTGLATFRTETLKPRPEGRLEIVNTVDRLTRDTGAQLASAVTFTTLNPSDEATQVGRKTGTSGSKSRKRSRAANDAAEGIRSFPSLNVTFSITGTYEQLRQFISKLEGSNQFLIVDKISLVSGNEPEGDSSTSSGFGGSGRRPAAPSGSGVVTLSLEMTAYFQPDTNGLEHAGQ